MQIPPGGFAASGGTVDAVGFAAMVGPQRAWPYYAYTDGKHGEIPVALALGARGRLLEDGTNAAGYCEGDVRERGMLAPGGQSRTAQTAGSGRCWTSF